MESLADLKTELTEWFDERIKTAVDEGNKDLMTDLDTRFGNLEKGVNDMGVMLSGVSRDVGGVSDSVAKLMSTVLSIPTSLAQTVEDTINRINPFRIP